MNWRMWLSLSVLLTGAVFVQSASSQDQIAALTADDLKKGQQIFTGQCALCHGIAGTGGRGPALNLARLRRASEDSALFRIIKFGIEGSEMPGFWPLSDREIWQVAGYVRSLGRAAAETLSGDAARGRELFAAKGCAVCHIVRGQGGTSGPELTEIGARRSAAYLREALTDPGAAVPEGYLVVTVITRDGRQVRGVRVNEDSFSLQLRDAGNRFHSFRKSDLREVKKEFGASTMPGYRNRLTASELDDLVAWLASLRGEQ